MKSLEAMGQYLILIQSKFKMWLSKLNACINICLYSSRLDTSESKGYPSEGGYFHEEAILLLRKFYIRENKHGKIKIYTTKIVLIIMISSCT